MSKDIQLAPALGPAHAGFIFRGIILQSKASNVDEVPAGHDTAVVRIEEVLHSPPAFSQYAGQSVTIRLAGHSPLAQGTSHIFHTNGWIYATNLALICAEVHPATPEAAEAARQRVATARAEKIRQRIASAEAIVTGQITELHLVPRSPSGFLLRRDPRWQEAVVQISQIERGTPQRNASGGIVIRFASSRDVKWARSPRFSLGDQGTWILGDTSETGAALRHAAQVPTGHYLVIGADDFYPWADRAALLSHLS